jgi:riboflavin transporter FmnP
MFVETPLPLLPSFLKLDFSEIPALLAAFSLGPVASIYVGLVKNLLHVPSTQTAGVGEMANFLIGCAFSVPAGLIYDKKKTRQSAAVALLAGGFTMTITAALLNYWLLIPLYLVVLGIPQEAIIAMGHSANRQIINLPTFIAYGIVPFNLIKAMMLSITTLVIYKRVSPILHK